MLLVIHQKILKQFLKILSEIVLNGFSQFLQNHWKLIVAKLYVDTWTKYLNNNSIHYYLLTRNILLINNILR